jgi:hypothetical protein
MDMNRPGTIETPKVDPDDIDTVRKMFQFHIQFSKIMKIWDNIPI